MVVNLRWSVRVGGMWHWATRGRTCPTGHWAAVSRRVLPWLLGPALYAGSSIVEENLPPILGGGE